MSEDLNALLAQLAARTDPIEAALANVAAVPPPAPMAVAIAELDALAGGDPAAVLAKRREIAAMVVSDA